MSNNDTSIKVAEIRDLVKSLREGKLDPRYDSPYVNEQLIEVLPYIGQSSELQELVEQVLAILIIGEETKVGKESLTGKVVSASELKEKIFSKNEEEGTEKKKTTKEMLEAIPHSHYKHKNMMMRIGSRIDKMLMQKGWSDKHLAYKMGVYEKDVRYWKAGTVDLDIKTLAKIEEVLDVVLIEVEPQLVKPSEQER